MAKISQKFQAPKVKGVLFASRNAEMHKLFANKTVHQIATELDLDEADLDIILGQNDIYSLLINNKGVDTIIPMSSALVAQFEAEGLDPEDIMSLQFRVTDAPVWEKNAAGVLTKTDRKAPFLNVGKAAGEFSYERKNIFEEESVEGRQ